MKPVLYFLTGPTASGKKELSLPVALALDAEIISLDSVKVYRHLNIGSAKPTTEDLRRVPHHLIDVVDPNQPFSAGKYRELAEEAIRSILSREKQVLFVGGTALYLKVMREGLFVGPAARETVRLRLEKLAEEHGREHLHHILTQVDPIAAERIHPNDLKRLVRALEVFELTGRPISVQQKEFGRLRTDFRTVVGALRRTKEDLSKRIDRRVEAMFEAGLVEEVRVVLSKFNLAKQLRDAVGYKEVIDHLGGNLTLPETVFLVKEHTRRMAKHQMTWFRSMNDISWVDVPERVRASELLGEVLQIYGAAHTQKES